MPACFSSSASSSITGSKILHTAVGDVRLLPDLSADEIKRMIRNILAELSIDNYFLDDLVVVPAVEIDPQAEIVQALATSAETITGMRPLVKGAGPACDGWDVYHTGYSNLLWVWCDLRRRTRR